MTTMTTIATTMVFLGIRISSPHSSAQRTLRPIPRIAQRPEPSEARTPVLEEGGQFPDSVRTLWAGFILTLGKGFRKEEESTMSEDQSVEEMAHEVLMRQAKVRAARTGEAIEEAMEAVLNTEAGAQLRELRDVPHDEESVEEWQVGMARERAEERAEDLGDNLEEHPEHPTHG
jgi:hypothetical protein